MAFLLPLLLALFPETITAPSVPCQFVMPDPPAGTFDGLWLLDADRSTAVDPWRNLSIDIRQDGEAIILKRMWRGSREGGAFVDSAHVVPGGPPVVVELGQWPDNRHLGAYVTGDSTKTVTARWEDGARTLITDVRLVVEVQQGTTPIRIYTEYRLSPEGDRLDVLELRSTRPRPIHYVFQREE